MASPSELGVISHEVERWNIASKSSISPQTVDQPVTWNIGFV